MNPWTLTHTRIILATCSTGGITQLKSNYGDRSAEQQQHLSLQQVPPADVVMERHGLHSEQVSLENTAAELDTSFDLSLKTNSEPSVCYCDHDKVGPPTCFRNQFGKLQTTVWPCLTRRIIWWIVHMAMSIYWPCIHQAPGLHRWNCCADRTWKHAALALDSWITQSVGAAAVLTRPVLYGCGWWSPPACMLARQRRLSGRVRQTWTNPSSACSAPCPPPNSFQNPLITSPTVTPPHTNEQQSAIQ